MRFCGDETALNYNPDLEEFVDNGCAYFGQCLYENGHDLGSRINGYYINELKWKFNIRYNSELNKKYLIKWNINLKVMIWSRI